MLVSEDLGIPHGHQNLQIMESAGWICKSPPDLTRSTFWSHPQGAGDAHHCDFGTQ